MTIDDNLGRRADGLIPALYAANTPTASKYEFTCMDLIPNGSGGTCIKVLFSSTVIIWHCLWLKLSKALLPQAVAGTITLST